jgi:hypothetical protein
VSIAFFELDEMTTETITTNSVLSLRVRIPQKIPLKIPLFEDPRTMKRKTLILNQKGKRPRPF